MEPYQLDILSRSFLFQSLPREAVAAFCADCRVEDFAPGQVIYDPARFYPAIAILLAGRAQVTNSHGLPMQRLATGDCFGVAAVFSGAAAYVTTVTACAQTRVVFITDRQLRGLFAQHPQAAVDYIAFLSGRIQFLNHKLDSLTADTARDSLLLWLRQHCRAGRVEVTDGYTALARELNLGRASLYRALDSLEAGGVIARQGKTIRMIDESNQKGNAKL